MSSKAPLAPFLAQNPFPKPLTQGFFYREKMRAIHRVMPDAEIASVLEVGGGQSGLSAMLFPEATITNIDLDASYVNAPCNLQARVTFLCGDATSLPFAEAAFDVVTMFDLLEHVLDHQAAVAEAIRVLKPGGYLLISTPNENWRYPYYSAIQQICPQDTDLMAQWGHVRRGYSMSDLESLLSPLPCKDWATFINPMTVMCHDIAFSKLSDRKKQAVCWGLSPLTWLSYWLHSPHAKGSETASAWQKTV